MTTANHPKLEKVASLKPTNYVTPVYELPSLEPQYQTKTIPSGGRSPKGEGLAFPLYIAATVSAILLLGAALVGSLKGISAEFTAFQENAKEERVAKEKEVALEQYFSDLAALKASSTVVEEMGILTNVEGNLEDLGIDPSVLSCGVQ